MTAGTFVCVASSLFLFFQNSLSRNGIERVIGYAVGIALVVAIVVFWKKRR